MVQDKEAILIWTFQAKLNWGNRKTQFTGCGIKFELFNKNAELAYP